MSNCYYVNRGLKCPLPIFRGIQESLSCIFQKTKQIQTGNETLTLRAIFCFEDIRSVSHIPLRLYKTYHFITIQLLNYSKSFLQTRLDRNLITFQFCIFAENEAPSIPLHCTPAVDRNNHSSCIHLTNNALTLITFCILHFSIHTTLLKKPQVLHKQLSTIFWSTTTPPHKS